jgi:hypothetical protein
MQHRYQIEIFFVQKLNLNNKTDFDQYVNQ